MNAQFNIKSREHAIAKRFLKAIEMAKAKNLVVRKSTIGKIGWCIATPGGISHFEESFDGMLKYINSY